MSVNWISFILGILIMSTIATVGFIIAYNKDSDYMALLMGPVAWFLLLIVYIYEKITYYNKYHDVRSLLICPDGEIRYVNNKLADTMLECTDMTYNFPQFKDHPEWDVNDWKKEFTCNMRYTPKKVWSQYEPISKEAIKYAKEHPFKFDENSNESKNMWYENDDVE